MRISLDINFNKIEQHLHKALTDKSFNALGFRVDLSSVKLHSAHLRKTNLLAQLSTRLKVSNRFFQLINSDFRLEITLKPTFKGRTLILKIEDVGEFYKRDQNNQWKAWMNNPLMERLKKPLLGAIEDRIPQIDLHNLVEIGLLKLNDRLRTEIGMSIKLDSLVLRQLDLTTENGLISNLDTAIRLSKSNDIAESRYQIVESSKNTWKLDLDEDTLLLQLQTKVTSIPLGSAELPIIWHDISITENGLEASLSLDYLGRHDMNLTVDLEIKQNRIVVEAVNLTPAGKTRMWIKKGIYKTLSKMINDRLVKIPELTYHWLSQKAIIELNKVIVETPVSFESIEIENIKVKSGLFEIFGQGNVEVGADYTA